LRCRRAHGSNLRDSGWVGTRRRWGVVTDIIFALLCMVIIGFFVSVLGVFGVFFYLTS